jgi:multidrug efflux pump subunit AcrB
VLTATGAAAKRTVIDSLVIVMGQVVDDAIIDVENIHRSS